MRYLKIRMKKVSWYYQSLLFYISNLVQTMGYRGHSKKCFQMFFSSFISSLIKVQDRLKSTRTSTNIPGLCKTTFFKPYRLALPCNNLLQGNAKQMLSACEDEIYILIISVFSGDQSDQQQSNNRKP